MKKPARVTGLFSGETGLNLGNLQSRSSGSQLPYMLESSRSLSETIRARARAGRDAHHFCLQSSCKQWPGVVLLGWVATSLSGVYIIDEGEG